jgi:hypothetical protein
MGLFSYCLKIRVVLFTLVHSNCKFGLCCPGRCCGCIALMFGLLGVVDVSYHIPQKCKFPSRDMDYSRTNCIVARLLYQNNLKQI